MYVQLTLFVQGDVVARVSRRQAQRLLLTQLPPRSHARSGAKFVEARKQTTCIRATAFGLTRRVDVCCHGRVPAGPGVNRVPRAVAAPRSWVAGSRRRVRLGPCEASQSNPRIGRRPHPQVALTMTPPSPHVEFLSQYGTIGPSCRLESFDMNTVSALSAAFRSLNCMEGAIALRATSTTSF